MASTNEERQKNSVLEYPKRIAKSIAFGAIDAVADEFPVLSNLVKSNEKAAKEVYDDVFNMNRNIKKLQALQDRLIFKPAKVAMDNFKESLSTGEFYSKTRKEQYEAMTMGLAMEAMMADEIDEDTMAMLNGEESSEPTPSEDGTVTSKSPIRGVPEITKGDTVVASILSKEIRTGTNCLAKAVSVTTDAQIQTARIIGNILTEQTQQHSTMVKAGLNEVINGINSVIQFNENILLQHAKNSLEYYTTMANLTQENNAILKEMVEMKRNLYSNQLGKTKLDETNIPQAVFANGGFNLKDYVQVITKNVTEKTMFGPIVQMLPLLPMMVADAIANPVHFLTKQGIKGLLGPQLRLAMNDLDASMMNYLRIGLAKLSRFGKTNKSGSILGQIFGYEPERTSLHRVDTSKLGKAARQWDMDDHMALTYAIPMHLSAIESALTGNKQRYFDFTTKKWTDMRKIQNAENARNKQLADSVSVNAKAYIEQILSTVYKPKNDEELVMRRKALDEFFKGMVEENGFNPEDIKKNPNKYGGAVIADIVLKLAENNKNVGRELLNAHGKLLEANEAFNNSISTGNLENLNYSELAYATGVHRIKNQFNSRTESIAGKIDQAAYGAKTNSLLEDILGVTIDIRDSMGKSGGKRGKYGRGSNGPSGPPSAPYIPSNTPGGASNTLLTDESSIDDLISVSATKAGSLDLASYGIDESKIDKKDPFNAKALRIVKQLQKLMTERWDRGRHGNLGPTDAWLHYMELQDRILRVLRNRNMQAIQYNDAISVSEDDLMSYTSEYMTNSNFDPKFMSVIDWNKFENDENYKKNIVGKAKIYEAIRNDNFYAGLFGDTQDTRKRSTLGNLLSGKDDKGNELSDKDKQKLLDDFAKTIEESMEKINTNMENMRLYNKSSMFSQFLGLTEDNRDYKAKMQEIGVDPNADFMTQLTSAADMGKKLQVLNANISEIVKAPRNMLTSVIQTADKVMYDFFFDKDTGLKDKNGKEIKGLFNRMTYEMGKTMDELNFHINDIFSNKNGFWDKANETIKNWFDIDIKETYKKGREYVKDKIINPAKESVKEQGLGVWSEIRDSVTGTIDDAFKTDLTGKLAERRKKLAEEEDKTDDDKLKDELEADANKKAKEAAGEAGQAAAGDYGVSGKTFLSKNELLSGSKGLYQVEKPGLYDLGRGKYDVIPGNMNPFISSASRSAYSVEANKQNENRIRGSLIDRLRSGDSKLAASLIPGYAAGSQPVPLNTENTDKFLNVVSQLAPDMFDRLAGENGKEFINAIFESADAAGIDRMDILKWLVSYAGEGANALSGKIGDGAIAGNLKQLLTESFVNMHESDFFQKDDEKRALLENFMRSAGFEGKFDTKSNIRNRKREARGDVTDRIAQFIDTAFGVAPGEAAEDIRKYTIKNTGNILKGGIGGALASTVFPLGGPLMGAIAGASAKLLSKNTSFMNYMFGTEIGQYEDENGNVQTERKDNGIIPQKFMKTLSKYAPDMKKYGIAGAIAGMITPFGPLGGVMAGVAASILKNNKTANDFFFGDEGGLLNKDRKAKIKKALPAIGTSVLATMFLGPFGLMGNAVLGSALGMLSTTEYFKKIVLGYKGKDGSRHGGLAGAIRAQLTNPFKKFMEESKKDFKKWWRDEIFRKLSRGLPSIGGLFKDMMLGAGKSLMKGIERHLGLNVSNTIEKWSNKALAGVRNVGKLPFNVAKFLGKHTIGAAASLIQNAGQYADRIRMERGTYMGEGAADRLKKSSGEMNGLRYAGEGFDKELVSMRNEGEIKDFARTLELLGKIHNGEGIDILKKRLQTGRDNAANVLARMNEEGKFSSGDYGSLSDVINNLSDYEKDGTYDAGDAYRKATELIDSNTRMKSDDREELKKVIEELINENRSTFTLKKTMSDSAGIQATIDSLLGRLNDHGVRTNLDPEELMAHAENWAKLAYGEIDLRKKRADEQRAKAESEGRIIDGSFNEFDATGTAKSAAEMSRNANTMESIFNMLQNPDFMNSVPEKSKAIMLGHLVATMTDHDAYVKMFKDSEAIFDYSKRKADKKTREEQERIDNTFTKLDAYDTLEGFAQDREAQETLFNIISNPKDDNEDQKNDLVRSLNLVKKSRDNGNTAKIKDIVKAVEIDEDGVLLKRIAILTAIGLEVKPEWYEDLQDMNEDTFKVVSEMADLGYRFEDLEVFTTITDSNEDKWKLKALRELAYVEVAQLYGGSKVNLSNYKTANEVFDKLRQGELIDKYFGDDKFYHNMQAIADEQTDMNHEITHDDWTKTTDFYDNAVGKAELGTFSREQAEKEYNKTTNTDITEITDRAAGRTASVLRRAGKLVGGAAETVLTAPLKAAKAGANALTGEVKYGDKISDFFRTAMIAATDKDEGILAAFNEKNKDKLIPQLLQNQVMAITDRFIRNKLNNNLVQPSEEAIKTLLDDCSGEDAKYFIPKYAELIDRMKSGELNTPDKVNDAIQEIHNSATNFGESILQTATQHAGGFFSKLGGMKNTALGFLGGSLASGGSDDKDKEDKSEEKDADIKDIDTGEKAKKIDGNIANAVVGATGISDDGAVSSRIEKMKDGRLVKLTSTKYGDLEYQKSSVDGQWTLVNNKNNQDIKKQMAEDKDIKQRSVTALESIAKNVKGGLGDKAKTVGKAASGGLFDMFKDLMETPKNLLAGLGNALGLLPLLSMFGIGKDGKPVPGAKGGKATGGWKGKIKGFGGKLAKGGLGALAAYFLLNGLFGSEAEASELVDEEGNPVENPNTTTSGRNDSGFFSNIASAAWNHPIMAAILAGGLGYKGYKGITNSKLGRQWHEYKTGNAGIRTSTSSTGEAKDRFRLAGADKAEYTAAKHDINAERQRLTKLLKNENLPPKTKEWIKNELERLKTEKYALSNSYQQKAAEKAAAYNNNKLSTRVISGIQNKLPSIPRPGMPSFVMSNKKLAGIAALTGLAGAGALYAGSNYSKYGGVTEDAQKAVGLKKNLFDGSKFNLNDLTREEQAQANSIVKDTGSEEAAFNFIMMVRSKHGYKPVEHASTNEMAATSAANWAKDKVVPDNGGLTRAALNLGATTLLPTAFSMVHSKPNSIDQRNFAGGTFRNAAMGGVLKTGLDWYYGDIDPLNDPLGFAKQAGMNVGMSGLSSLAFNHFVYDPIRRRLRNPRQAYDKIVADNARAAKINQNKELAPKVAELNRNLELKKAEYERIMNNPKATDAQKRKIAREYNKAIREYNVKASEFAKTNSAVVSSGRQADAVLSDARNKIKEIRADKSLTKEQAKNKILEQTNRIRDARQQLSTTIHGQNTSFVMQNSEKFNAEIAKVDDRIKRYKNLLDKSPNNKDMIQRSIAALESKKEAIRKNANELGKTANTNFAKIQAVPEVPPPQSKSIGELAKTAVTEGKTSGIFSKGNLAMMAGLGALAYASDSGTAEAAESQTIPGTSIPKEGSSTFSNLASGFYRSLINPKHSLSSFVMGDIADRQAHGADLSAGDMATAAASGIASGTVLNAGMSAIGSTLSEAKNSKTLNAIKEGAKAYKNGGNIFEAMERGSNSVEGFKLKNIGEDLKTKSKNYFSDTFGKVKDFATGDVAKNAERLGEGARIKQADEIVTKCKAVIEKITYNMKRFIPSEKLAGAVAKFGEIVLNQLKKPAVMNRVIVATSRSAASSIPVLGTLMAAGFGVYEAYAGWNNAEALLKIPKGSATSGMKLMCAMCSALTAAPYVGIIAAIAENYILELAISSGLFCSPKEVEELRKQADPKYEKKEYADRETYESKQIKDNVQQAKGETGDLVRAAEKDKESNTKSTIEDASKKEDTPKDNRSMFQRGVDAVSSAGSWVGEQISSGIKSAKEAWDNWHPFSSDDDKQGKGKYGRGPAYNEDSEDDDLMVRSAKAAARLRAQTQESNNTLSTTTKPTSEDESRKNAILGATMTGQAMQTEPGIADMSMNISGDTEKQTAGDTACGPVSVYNLISSYNQDDPNDDISVREAKRKARIKSMINQSLKYKAVNDGIRPEGLKNLVEQNSDYKSFVTRDKSTMFSNLSQPGAKAVLMGGGASAFGSNKNSNTDLDYYSDSGQHYVEVENLGNNIAAVKDPQDGLMFDRMDNVVNRSNTGVMLDARGKFGRAKNKHSKLLSGAYGVAAGRSKFTSTYGRRKKYGRAKGGSLDGVTEEQVLKEMMYVAAGIAKKVGSKHPELFFGQIIQETGGPASYIANNKKYNAGHDHNYGGFTWYEGMGEEYKGVPRPQSEGGYYATFDSDDEYIDLLYEKVYKSYADEMAKVETPEEFAQTIKNHGYFADSNVQGYADGIRSAIERYATELKDIGNIDVSNIKTGSKGGSSSSSSGAISGLLQFFQAIHDRLSLFGGSSSFSGGSSGNFTSSSSDAGIREASAWAESMVGQEGYGNNGCTAFVKNYLLRAGNKIGEYMEDGTPIADQLKKAAKDGNATLMWVPTFEQWAKDQGIFKEASKGGAEGDVCICNGSGHVVIADGKGGCWGNSSSKNQIVHYKTIDNMWSSVEGYVATGAGKSVVSDNSGPKRSKEEMIADAGTSNAGSGKFGLGKFGRAILNKLGLDTDKDKSGGNPYSGLPHDGKTTIFGKGKFGRGIDSTENEILSLNNLKGFENPVVGDFARPSSELSMGITPQLKKNAQMFTGAGKGKFGRGTEVPQAIWNYLEPKYGPVATAGIMGNMYQESSFNPSADNGSGAYGLVQWMGDRNTNMRSYAQSKGKPWDDLYTQLEFLDQEISGNQKYVDTIEQMKSMTPEDAAAKWEEVFERSGGSAIDRRRNAAKEVFEKKGAVDSSVSITGSSSGGSSSGGATGGIFGALFDKVGSIIDKMKAPVTAGMKAFGGALSNILAKSPLGKMAGLLFGDNNPLAQIASMFKGEGSKSGGSNGSNGKASSNPVAANCPVDGSCGDAMKKMLNCEITSPYGPRFGGSDVHDGIDYGVGDGTDVPSVCEGTVDDVNKSDSYGAGYGYYVVIKDHDGRYHMYAHNSQPLVSKGETVTAGQIIAKSGHSGHCVPDGPDGAHLHYGIHHSADCSKGTGTDPMSVPVPKQTAAGKYGRSKLKTITIKPKSFTTGSDLGLTETPDSKNAYTNKFMPLLDIATNNIKSENQFGTGKYGRSLIVSTGKDQLKDNPIVDDTIENKDWDTQGYEEETAEGKYGRGFSLEDFFKEQYNAVKSKIDEYKAKITNRGKVITHNPFEMKSGIFGIPIVPETGKLGTENKGNSETEKKSNNIFVDLTNKITSKVKDFTSKITNPFKDFFKGSKKKDATDSVADTPKVESKSEIPDFDNMSFEDMKKWYESVDVSTVTNKENIPDWENDDVSVIRSKLKSLAKSVQNKKDETKTAPDKTVKDAVTKGKNAFVSNTNDIKDKAKKLAAGVDVIDKDSKPTSKEIAPNGKPYEENDIQYLLNNGYTREDAIKFLSTDKKYASVEGKPSNITDSPATGAVTNKEATEKKEITKTEDQISIKILEAQNKTNELLAALLQAVTGHYDQQQKSNDTKVKEDRVNHMKDNLNSAKESINMVLSPSKVGLGRAFSGGSTSSGAEQIIPALNALIGM